MDFEFMSTEDLLQMFRELSLSEDQSDIDFAKECAKEIARRKPKNERS